jgi:hypothetical protein
MKLYGLLSAGTDDRGAKMATEGLTTLGSYYVTVIDGGRTGLLAGPYATQGQASRMVAPARKIAQDRNRDAVWYAFGVSRIASTKPGVLQRAGLL